jgi:hypothetical protein
MAFFNSIGMTKKELSSFKWSLKNDPTYIINFILDNNLPAVIDNFISAGYTSVVDKEEALEAINDILKDSSNGLQKVISILSVPMNPDNLPDGIQDLVLEVAKSNVTKLASTAGQDANQLKSLSQWGQEGIGLDNIFGAVAGALNGLVAGGGTAINGPTYGQYGSQYQYGQNWTGQKNNSMIWIILAIIALIVIIYLMFFRKK